MFTKKSMKLSILFVVVALAVSACSFGNLSINPVNPAQPTSSGATSTQAPATGTQEALPTLPAQTALNPTVLNYSDLSGTLEALYQKVDPGIVSIQFTSTSGSGQGSGFVIDKEGHIVTNYHVAGDTTSLEVDFPSGLKVPATLIGGDPDSDLAVIKVDVPADQLTPLTLGDSDTALVGETVVAIGNPYGLSGTMTMGIVSARGRVLDSLRQSSQGIYFSAGDLIQTDASINPGNSGGPLLNLNGEVIGVNRAIQTSGQTISGDPVNTGIGFAVSSNIVRKVLPSLIANGSYDYPYLGLSSINSLDLEMIQALGLTQTTGAYISEVVPGGPADRAGLRSGSTPTSIQGLYAGGDLITAVDSKPIKEFSELLSYMVLNKAPGDVINFTVLRDGESMDVQVTLGKRP